MEILILLLMLAATLRDLASVVSAIVGLDAFPLATSGQQLGNDLQWAGGFGDGQGVLLLLVILAFTWWHLWSRGATSPGDLEYGRYARLRRFLYVDLALFCLNTLGSLAFAIGCIVGDAGLGTRANQWQHFLGNGGFYLAYAIAGAGGAYATYRLTSAMRSPGSGQAI